MMKIVFFGTPDFAAPALRDLHADPEVEVLTVVTAPDKPAGRGRQLRPSHLSALASELGIPCLKPSSLKDETFLNQLRDLGADLFVVIAFRKLPKVVWNMPPRGTFNVHGSLLPDLRGAAPIQWAIAHGDQHTGVTSFLINENIDEGAILDVIRIELDANATVGSIYAELSELASELCIRTIKGIFNGSYSPRNQQSSEELRVAPKIDKVFSELDGLSSAWDIHNRIRACDPFPGASLPCPDDNSLRIKVYDSLFDQKSTSDDRGVALEITDDAMRIHAPGGQCLIGEIQYPGKKKMAVKDFLRGYRTRGIFEFN